MGENGLPRTKTYSIEKGISSKPTAKEGNPSGLPEPMHIKRSLVRGLVASFLVHLIGSCLLGLILTGQLPPSRTLVVHSVTSGEVLLPLTVFNVEDFRAVPMMPVKAKSETIKVDTSLVTANGNVGFDSFSPMLFNPVVEVSMSERLPEAMGRVHHQATAMSSFHGIPTSGKRIVYVIDCSKSMGYRFEMAIASLLRSIRQLSVEQTFNVILFDKQTHLPLQLKGSPVERGHSPMPETIDRLRLRLEQMVLGPGGSPEAAFKLAMSLEPDTVFLLTDGEFPNSVCESICQLNQDVNGFGEHLRRATIHTIQYGERRKNISLVNIAGRNGGTYQNVGLEK